ncbi:hypothetical protein HanRHA438_Chr09g0411521 [Helianthus annuus]|uniref:Uncharacterized protein n=1 Tax=Helianthus annuus TaxID=4232 RepID=A0A9K3I853_HELAN|nr:hypothetical protein HanXRQr2_Chr09g0399671 [Helianthus annuus]KAJ0535431.1 hypothetical protein HanIR_Chr09g0430591 [Helianthus annuus]KAJ0543275.1 hypothetical protein HanHA89_Chr09g0348971 [Helianthus annuus]KAJ0708331.1 hypothetical protein HanLR1_Chr09g0328301 [Helianthus annuus]KAJ0889310.1 hypothetical protein HanRHA438_Chr09g0411521 [Helianthus annuus]
MFVSKLFLGPNHNCTLWGIFHMFFFFCELVIKSLIVHFSTWIIIYCFLSIISPFLFSF